MLRPSHGQMPGSPTASDPVRDELRAFMEAALVDDEAHAARVAVCSALAETVARTGRVLWAGSWLLRDRGLEGVAILTEMAGELATGAVSLFREERWYAGAALVRQLVEVEYLMYLFSADRAEAARWLVATPEELRREFQPQRMRKRSGGRFRDTEYWSHCELGGHPNRKGRALLRDHTPLVGSHRAGWADLGHHLERLWGFFLQALALHESTDLLPEQAASDVSELLRMWHERDPLATRLTLPQPGSQ